MNLISSQTDGQGVYNPAIIAVTKADKITCTLNWIFIESNENELPRKGIFVVNENYINMIDTFSK